MTSLEVASAIRFNLVTSVEVVSARVVSSNIDSASHQRQKTCVLGRGLQLNPALTWAVCGLTSARFALRASNQVPNCLLQRKLSEIAPRFEWKRIVTQIWLAWRAQLPG